MPQSWQKLTFRNAHPRDAHIHFDEPTHKYYVNGTCKGNISCTGFIHEFFEHFDAKAIIAKMKKSSTWSTSKYYGKTDKEIMDEWNANGYTIIITTARPVEAEEITIKALNDNNLPYHGILFGLPNGDRVVLNDIKEGRERAFAYNLERNGGIGHLDL